MTSASWMASQGAGEPAPQPQQLGPVDGTVLLHDLVERGPRHVAGHEIGAVAVEVGVDDRGHPRVLDPAQHVDLAAQPGAGVAVVGDVRAQQLEGDGAAVRVEGQVDDTHAALTQLLDEAIRPDETRGRRPRAVCVAVTGLRRHAPTVSEGAG